jgi:hypothetical protein
MKMEPVNENYKKVLEILKQSKPVLNSSVEIEENVMERISPMRKHKRDFAGLIDFVFGWTYITWVRRSLITASVFLVLVFVLQQGLLIMQINNLGRKIDSYEKDASGVNREEMSRRLLIFRLSDKRFPKLKKGGSDKQLEELFRSIDDLKAEYKDLHIMIEQDPELKKLIEQKLSEITESKVKL